MSHPVDILVGKRLRARRTQLCLSQTKLGEMLGVTFQQIQKYEKGLNRVSCSRLIELCAALKVQTNYFFGSEGPEYPHVSLLDSFELDTVGEGQRLLAAFRRITDQETRYKTIELLESIAAQTT